MGKCISSNRTKAGEGNIACMDSIHIGFVYLDEDIIS